MVKKVSTLIFCITMGLSKGLAQIKNIFVHVALYIHSLGFYVGPKCNFFMICFIVKFWRIYGIFREKSISKVFLHVFSDVSYHLQKAVYDLMTYSWFGSNKMLLSLFESEVFHWLFVKIRSILTNIHCFANPWYYQTLSCYISLEAYFWDLQ